MTILERCHSPVYRQLQAYGESWKVDHLKAMACRDWEDAIAVGVNIFRMLTEREQTWRDQVFRETIAFAEDDNLDHQARFANWLETTNQVIAKVLPELETRYGAVDGAQALRQYAQLVEMKMREWQPPKSSQAVAFRELTLAPDAAAELDRVLDEAKRHPPSMPVQRLETQKANFLLQ